MESIARGDDNGGGNCEAGGRTHRQLRVSNFKTLETIAPLWELAEDDDEKTVFLLQIALQSILVFRISEAIFWAFSR